MRTKMFATLTAVFLFIALLALLTSAGSVAQGAAPSGGTVPYSGYLSNDAGQPVADGMYAFSFALYDAVLDGKRLWSETQPGVAVTGGAFSVQLGSIAALPETARIKSVWLAVGVRGPDETVFTALNPRQYLDVVAAAAPSSPADSVACAHDHFGESWSGSTTVYGTAFEVENTVIGGTGIKGIANLGTGVRYGVYGESLGSHGVYGKTDSGFGVYGEGVQNGTGVVGTSNTGVGVLAWSTSGTAIKIHGAIAVDGAGIDSDTPVFIHKVDTSAGGNICSIQTYATVIDNPISNNRPNAILIVTPNFGANNAGVAPVDASQGVYYDATNQCGKGAGKWVIYSLNGALAPQVNNSMYNVIVVAP